MLNCYQVDFRVGWGDGLSGKNMIYPKLFVIILNIKINNLISDHEGEIKRTRLEKDYLSKGKPNVARVESIKKD